MYANTYIWNLKKKKGSDEPRSRTGVKSQMWRVVLGTWGRGSVGLDEVGE